MHSSPPLSVRLRYSQIAYLGAILLCVYAVSTLSDEPRALLNLGTWLGLAAMLALTAYLSTSPLTWWTRINEWAQARGLRPVLLLLAVGIGLLTCIRFLLYLRIGTDFKSTTAMLWLTAAGLLVASAWPAQPLGVRAWAALHRRELLQVLGLTATAAALRFWKLGSVPKIINGDEGLIGMWAQDTTWASGILTTPFSAMDGVGTFYLRVMNTVFGLIGPTQFSLRLLPAIAGTLAIPATYLLARRLFSPRTALIAAALLTLSHVHIHFSRTVAVSYIYTTLFVPLALYFLLSGLERRSPLRMILSVLMVGLHINTYVDGWVWLVLLFLLLASWAIIDRGLFRGNAVPLAMFAVALVVIISPMVIWGVLFPAEFSSRMAVDGTFTSGWLETEAALTGKHQALVLGELFLAALGTFTQRPFIDFYGVGVPTLDKLTGIFWTFGLALALWQTFNRRVIVLNGWFWGGVVALGVTTVPPSTYHYRLLVVLPAAMIMAAHACDTLLRRVEREREQSLPNLSAAQLGSLQKGLAVVALAFIAYSNLTTYFGVFAGACKYETIETRQAGLLGRYLHGLPRETDVFVLPQEHGFRAGPFRSVDFLSGRMELTNIDEPLGAELPAALKGAGEDGLLVVAVPGRADELELVEAWYPGGQRMALLDCGSEALWVYDWRASGATS